MSLIVLNDIVKHYVMGQETVRALDGISLTIAANEYIAFTGSSGSGKSTMMNILGALDKPSSGSYLLNNRDVSQLNQDELAEIRNHEVGFIFQSFNLLPRLSALGNVMQPLIYRGMALKAREQGAATPACPGWPTSDPTRWCWAPRDRTNAWTPCATWPRKTPQPSRRSCAAGSTANPPDTHHNAGAQDKCLAAWMNWGWRTQPSC